MTRHSEIQLYPWPTLALQSTLVRFTLVWDEILQMELKQVLNTEHFLTAHYKSWTIHLFLGTYIAFLEAQTNRFKNLNQSKSCM